MLRRSFLGFLGGAPIALPAVARAALVPLSSLTILVEAWAAYGQAAAAWFDANAELIATAGLDLRPEDVAALGRAEHARWASLGLDAPAAPPAALPGMTPCAFRDDVGSGP